MKLGRARSVGLVGLEATVVEVEAVVGGGLPRTVIVGLPDAALNEARDRCRAALAQGGFGWPDHLVTINLSPASLPKAGTHYDLAIAGAVLEAAGAVPQGRLGACIVLGELGLDASVRAVRGVLPAVLAAAEAGYERAVVPAAQVAEAALVEGIDVVGVSGLGELVSWLRDGLEPVLPAAPAPGAAEAPLDLADVAGQLEARWALEVAAAGRHHLFLTGPPGVGKTLLAERLPGILPPLSTAEALEVAAIRSVAGLPVGTRLSRRAPFSAPHHSASMAAMVGGGPRIALPGAISLAHRGVLFLDEAPEFGPRALDALRTPLESGHVVLARAQAQTRYPSRFQLVLASNPCPCGRSGVRGGGCECTPWAVRRYTSRLSGPILDRVDIHQPLHPMTKSYLRAAGVAGEPSAAVAERVAEARARQLSRLAPLGLRTNAEVPGAALRRALPRPDGIEILESAMARGLLSLRGLDKVLRLAWTIADLFAAPSPSEEHVRTAMALRRGEDDPSGPGRGGDEPGATAWGDGEPAPQAAGVRPDRPEGRAS